MTTTSAAVQVSELKDQGNQLFRKKDYTNAISKFTEALELDGGSNAVLLANRAACHLALKRYDMVRNSSLF
jgi:stress-induced-phosphoprotein 1